MQTSVVDYFPRAPWPHQLRGVEEVLELLDAGERRICVGSPTGMGKSVCQMALIFKCLEERKKVVVYQSRKALVDQFVDVFEQNGIPFGVRSASQKEHLRLLEDVQISSMQTEDSWVYRSKRYDLHQADLVIIDEIHMNKAKTCEKILADHDCPVVGFTATPMEVGHICDKLVIAGTKQEGRQCGALIPADVYAPDEIDTQKLAEKSSMFTQPEVAKLYTPRLKKQIIGSVLENYHKLNPEQVPCLLFAPGVAESLWFCQEFERAGISAAHIDGSDLYVDGEERTTNEAGRREIFKRFRAGDIKVVCNRFVLREGVDLPEIGHLILATAFGSLVSYLQSVGRGLRNHPDIDRLIIQDHGGNWHRHPSPNADIDWHDLWELTPYQAYRLRVDAFREREEREPQRCPECDQIRGPGVKVCRCGARYTKSSRRVVQVNGELSLRDGDVYKPRRRAKRPNTEQVWEKIYYRAKKSRNKMTFSQAEGLFFYENHYWPPRDLPLMPENPQDWVRKVCRVPREKLK